MGDPKLPAELWLEILRLSLPARNLKRILRQRLVNKLFASEILHLLPGHPILSAHLSPTDLSSYYTNTPPNSLQAAHLIHYLKSSPEDKDCKHLSVIKDVAIALAKADIQGRSVDDFLAILCPLAASRTRYPLWSPITWWDIDSRTRYPPTFSTELFVAALHTQVHSVVEDVRQGNHGPCFSNYSDFFGNAYQGFTAIEGNHHLIKSLVLNDDFTGNTRRGFLRYAVEYGDLDLVKLIWDHNADKHPWTFAQFPRESYDGHRNNRLLARMHTPSLQVFEWLMEKRRAHCIGKSWGPEQWTGFLVRCAREGWVDMAKHYLELGAVVRYVHNGHKDVYKVLLARGARVDNSALQFAVKYHDEDVVEMLLGGVDEGLDMRTTIMLAMRAGQVRMVRTLFEHCPEAREVAQETLVQAVRIEHEELVRLLVELVGGVAADHVRDECLNMCREEGLESMERLLDELQPVTDA